jgi:hypothetical protein
MIGAPHRAGWTVVPPRRPVSRLDDAQRLRSRRGSFAKWATPHSAPIRCSCTGSPPPRKSQVLPERRGAHIGKGPPRWKEDGPGLRFANRTRRQATLKRIGTCAGGDIRRVKPLLSPSHLSGTARAHLPPVSRSLHLPPGETRCRRGIVVFPSCVLPGRDAVPDRSAMFAKATKTDEKCTRSGCRLISQRSFRRYVGHKKIR